MTEAEAIQTLGEQFQGRQGFLAKLERGAGLDREALARARQALSALQEAWSERNDVPKAPLLPLVDIGSRIRRCIRLNPQIEDDLLQLSTDLEQEIEHVIFGSLIHTEEWAMEVVFGSLGGIDSLALTLHHRQPVNGGFVEDLQIALEVLAKAWRNRESVPRQLAGLMLGAGDLFRDHAGNYPQRLYPGMLDETAIENIGDDVTKRVQRCFGSVETE